jgi:hypothetical protein
MILVYRFRKTGKKVFSIDLFRSKYPINLLCRGRDWVCLSPKPMLKNLGVKFGLKVILPEIQKKQAQLSISPMLISKKLKFGFITSFIFI